MALPAFLYRGDNDKDSKRIRPTIRHHQFQTNLLNGGNGRQVFEEPLLQLINRHVAVGWDKTHFLSFTESEDIAKRFGIHCSKEEFPTRSLEYTECYDDTDGWDFAILAFDSSRGRIHELSPGVFECFFQPALIEFARFNRPYRLILFDVFKILMLTGEYDRYQYAIENADADKEWLLLPAFAKDFNGHVEFSGILDGGCISRCTKYSKHSASHSSAFFD